MNARFINLGQARKVDGTELGTLGATSKVALAIAQAIGTSATKNVSERQSWTLTALAAIEIQDDYANDTALRAVAWAEWHDAVQSELRGKIVAELVSKLGLAKDVTQGKADDKSPLTSLQSLLVKAQTKLDNYTQRVEAAWKAGLLVKFDTLGNGDKLPEASGKLQTRTAEANAKAAPVTADSQVKAYAGQLAGNIIGLASDFNTAEQSAAIKGLLEAVNAVILRYSADVLTTVEINDTAAQLLAFGAEVKTEEAAEPLTNLESLLTEGKADESAEAEEIREELGIATA